MGFLMRHIKNIQNVTVTIICVIIQWFVILNVDHSKHFQCIFQYLTSMLITIFSLTISMLIQSNFAIWVVSAVPGRGEGGWWSWYHSSSLTSHHHTYLGGGGEGQSRHPGPAQTQFLSTRTPVHSTWPPVQHQWGPLWLRIFRASSMPAPSATNINASSACWSSAPTTATSSPMVSHLHGLCHQSTTVQQQHHHSDRVGPV